MNPKGSVQVTKREIAYIAEHDHWGSETIACELGKARGTVIKVRRLLETGELKPAFNLTKLHRRAIGL